jgi:hypothetical protein
MIQLKAEIWSHGVIFEFELKKKSNNSYTNRVKS